MKISYQTLLAYVDNELDAAARAEVEAAIAADPELARRVEQQRSLRKLLGAAYGPVLEEPVPPRLLAAAQPAPAKPKVVELAAAREIRRPRVVEPVIIGEPGARLGDGDQLARARMVEPVRLLAGAERFFSPTPCSTTLP